MTDEQVCTNGRHVGQPSPSHVEAAFCYGCNTWQPLDHFAKDADKSGWNALKPYMGYTYPNGS